MKDKKKPSIIDTLIFLFPRRLIRQQHFSKKDVQNIKDNLVMSFSLVYLIIGAILAALTLMVLILNFVNSDYKYVEVYGLPGLIGHIAIAIGSVLTVIFVIISRKSKNENRSRLFARLAGDALFISSVTYMFFCIVSDAKMGFTQNSETLSASIIFIAIIVLIQPMHWNDALVLDIATSIELIGLSIYCKVLYSMGALHYYVLIALVYPFACFMVISLLFYAESQRYRQVLENERLHNHAYYDALTKCKNRHALSEFIDENKHRWEGKENVNLLIIMFDIDNFKLYNDQFSHLGGDYCLKSICDAVRQEFPSPSLDFFRYGGEEFLLFFELRNIADAPKILNKVKESVSTLHMDAPKGAPKEMVTISVGGLLVRSIKQFEFEDELKIVDTYLYKAKNAGKDIVCYNGDLIN